MRPQPDPLLQDIADYVVDYKITSKEALQAASLCLMDALGCALQSLQHDNCVRLLGPSFDKMQCKHGARVPGTNHTLDPVQAAFNLGIMIRWLDFNDTWLAAEWSHPSDNLGGILAVADYLAGKSDSFNNSNLTMQEVLEATVKAYEIQGVLALENSFNRVGLDHVLLVRIATCAVVTAMFGGTKTQVINAISNAWVDGGALRIYRHAPNTGSRKSWAAGDATARGVWHAVMSLKGEMGYPSTLTEAAWGFQDVLFGGEQIKFSQSLGSYVIENVLFKVKYPAEFHAQTAAEAATKLHSKVIKRISEINKIEIYTQESAIRIIDKSGPLTNPADRDHCLQYIVAVTLLSGDLSAQHYYSPFADDSRIDELRTKMVVKEDPLYSEEYLDPDKRSVTNSIQVFFKDGTATGKVEIRYPLGHRKRRLEAIPLLKEKFKKALINVNLGQQAEHIVSLFQDFEMLSRTPVNNFVQNFIPRKQ